MNDEAALEGRGCSWSRKRQERNLEESKLVSIERNRAAKVAEWPFKATTREKKSEKKKSDKPKEAVAKLEKRKMLGNAPLPKRNQFLMPSPAPLSTALVCEMPGADALAHVSHRSSNTWHEVRIVLNGNEKNSSQQMRQGQEEKACLHTPSLLDGTQAVQSQDIHTHTHTNIRTENRDDTEIPYRYRSASLPSSISQSFSLSLSRAHSHLSSHPSTPSPPLTTTPPDTVRATSLPSLLLP